MTRREEREEAFALLFEYEFQPRGTDELFSDAEDGRGYSGSSFTRQLVTMATAYLPEIDACIDRHIKKWTKKRLSKVSLGILLSPLGILGVARSVLHVSLHHQRF